MNKIKDFLYYISDLILAFIVIVILFIVFYKNINVFFYDIFGDNKLSVKSVQNIVSQTKKEEDESSEGKDNIKIAETEIYDEGKKSVYTSSVENQAGISEEESVLQNETPKEDVVIKNITVIIPEAAISNDIVNILYDNNLISSKEEMSDYLKKNNLDTRLKSGTFTLNTSMSIEEIAETLSL